jgi:hypothetical protein
MLNYGVTIFPTGAAATVTDGITTAISENIGVILAVLAFVVGINFVLRLFRKSTHGKV